ncbi:uncharacterized protein LOC125677400 [Ostrea edulis]|uniref:uncharacterized protein LOC125677400 n=1 Tax=Ostrea edulis TaxID=37623 RepID=UPI0024AFE615|nr:uncharacterized protein LOC125677400 [Ostrea edulis]
MAPIWITVFAACVCVTGILACDDLDSAACVRLASSRPDMCNDTCLASICKRHCGLCPLKCYTCHDIVKPETCNISAECPSNDHKCISVKSYTDDFRLVYKLGCAPSSVCSGTNCCSTDMCNNQVISKRQAKVENERNSVVTRRQTLSPTCADLDNLACTLLFTSNTDICQNDCVANAICPRLCGRCTECYDCDHVMTTERCNHSRICKAGEVCFTLETLNFDLEHGYRMGCVHQQICDKISTQVGNVFGRRSNIEVSMTGGCCHGDLCNHHKLTPASISTKPPPTTVPTISTTTSRSCVTTHGCPFSPAAKYNGECYFLGATMMTWLEAKLFCESHCSHLAVFRDVTDLRHTLSVVSHDDNIEHLPAIHRHNLPDVYVDAINPAHSGQFIWETTLEFVPSSMFDTSKTLHLYNCAVAHHDKLHGVSCTSTNYPLCQTRVQ